MVGKGIVKIKVNHTYPLKDAVQAHRDLEARKTTGSIVLLPCRHPLVSAQARIHFTELRGSPPARR